MEKNPFFIFGVMIFCSASCSTSSKPLDLPQPDPSPSPTPSVSITRPTALSHEMSSTRSKQIAHVSYVLWFGLDAAHNDFEGRTVIHFELKPKAKDYGSKVMLDLEEGTLQSVNLNGTNLIDLSKPERFDGHHLYFRMTELNPTSNRIEIAYLHPYSSDGNGLHRFKDPSDEKIYLYSHFEPYSAHRMFPCFDQPDLKASFELTVEAPKDWEVISNTLPRDINNVDGRRSWAFPPSPLLSPYLFALHAGPYHSWKSDANGIPIRLLARKSISPYINSEEWLKITRQGLDFFGTQFGFPYPFSKYDQIIVPDFNGGAMENAGAVTFSERYVHRTRMTIDQRSDVANVILHEMAHMWFGDLVTMRWWNGLWLNESFATFMAAYASEQATEFKTSWLSFLAGAKHGAYREDGLATTHPIEMPVPNTDQAKANFDSITYGKGASVLKQLNYLLGQDDFREGLQRYFQKYAYKNTTLHDFFNMLSEASGKDLSQWQHSWLQTSGVNTLEVKWQCTPDPESQESKISQFDLIQTASPLTGEGLSGHLHTDGLRQHRTQIALYHFPKNHPHSKAPLSPKEVLETTYSGSQTSLQEAIGKPCPDFIFPNYQDYDYVKVNLDPVSLAKIQEHMGNLSDALTRQMAWQNLWDRVLDGEMRSQDYADLVLKHAPHEKDTRILSKMLRTLASPYAGHDSVLRFLKPDLRPSYLKRFEDMARSSLSQAPHESDLQHIWFNAFLDSATSPHSVQFAKALLEGKQKLRGLPIDQERRWQLIQTLARNNADGAAELINEELKRDNTDMGQKASIAALSMISKPESKKKWLTDIFESKEIPFPKLREAMTHFQILNQEEWVKASATPYFQFLPKIALSPSNGDEEYARWLTSSMYPSLCDPWVVQMTEEVLLKYPNLPTPILKRLKSEKQNEERCIQARKKSASSL